MTSQWTGESQVRWWVEHRGHQVELRLTPVDTDLDWARNLVNNRIVN